MNNVELITYIKSNTEIMYRNFTAVFDFDKSEFKILILNLMMSFNYNDTLNEKEYSTEIFSINSLSNLKSTLVEVGLSDDEIKKIIIKSPIILLYSNKLNYIYYLYKNKKYYGYTILNEDNYSTYLLNDNLNSNIISNNYITEKMLEYYNVKNFDKEVFDSLETDFKLKNYYFKAKRKM